MCPVIYQSSRSIQAPQASQSSMSTLPGRRNCVVVLPFLPLRPPLLRPFKFGIWCDDEITNRDRPAVSANEMKVIMMLRNNLFHSFMGHVVGAGLGVVLAISTATAQDERSPAPETEAAERLEAREEERPEEEPIETDRDSFTPATTTAGRNRAIFESAYTFIDNRHVKETHSFPEMLLRYGVTDWLELRIGWNYEVGGAGNETSGAGFNEGDLLGGGGLERESNISYGLKAALTDACGWTPGSALIFQARTPTSGESNETQFVGTYVCGWKLGHDWQLDGAIRCATAEEVGDRFEIWAPSVVVKTEFAERWNAHIEWFGTFSDGRDEEFSRCYISPGIHHLVTPDLELGVRVGWGLNEDSARFFANAGIGWRF